MKSFRVWFVLDWVFELNFYLFFFCFLFSKQTKISKKLSWFVFCFQTNKNTKKSRWFVFTATMQHTFIFVFHFLSSLFFFFLSYFPSSCHFHVTFSTSPLSSFFSLLFLFFFIFLSVSLSYYFLFFMVLAPVMVLALVMVLAPVLVLAPCCGVGLCYGVSRVMSLWRGSHGLSARRARRTKSRGLKGLQLESLYLKSSCEYVWSSTLCAGAFIAAVISGDK